jgi:hypothetical protein
MLVNRIMGAFEFRREVYAQVREDITFTKTAWLLVVVSAFLNQVGSHASANLSNWLISTLAGTATAIIGFALAAFVMERVARALFWTEVTFDALVRTLGLAYVWSAVGILGVLSAFISGLSCLLAPVMFAALILLVIAWFVAAHEALEVEWGRAIVIVLLGWIILVVFMIGTRVVLSLLGLSTAALGGLVGF